MIQHLSYICMALHQSTMSITSTPILLNSPIFHNSLATLSAAIHPQNHSPDLWSFSQCDKTHIFASNIVVEVHYQSYL